ncbi:unnamed protein product [Camellia sinensis]
MPSSEAVVNLPKNVTVPAVIAFGDSIVDQGNNNVIETIAKCNFPPYGKDFVGGPTGRFGNGKTPADLIAEQLGIKEYVPAYLDPHLQPSELLTGVSFGSGASGFDPQTAQLASVLSMSDQLNLFKEYIGKVKGMVGEERTNFILSNSFYLVLAGSDDLTNTYFTAGIRKLQYDINSYTDLVVQYASDFVKELYLLGAKKIGLFGAAPIGCLPSQRTLAGGELRVCSEIYNQAAQLMNSKLSSAITSYNNSLNDPKARIVYIDIYNSLLNIILNHDKYGLSSLGWQWIRLSQDGRVIVWTVAKEGDQWDGKVLKDFQTLFGMRFSVADKGCCGTGNLEVSILCNKLTDPCPNDSVYVFWDSYHPTERCYRVLVNQVLQSSLNKFF